MPLSSNRCEVKEMKIENSKLASDTGNTMNLPRCWRRVRYTGKGCLNEGEEQAIIRHQATSDIKLADAEDRHSAACQACEPYFREYEQVPPCVLQYLTW